MRNRLAFGIAFGLVLNTPTSAPIRAAQADVLSAVQQAVSIAEIEKTLHAIDLDRTSGKDGERQAAAYLEQKLGEYGVRHARYDMRAYLSWPKRAELTVNGPEGLTLRAVTPAFSAPTPAGGLTGEVLFLPVRPDREGEADTGGPLGPEARGKIVVASGMIAPESALRAQRAGAAGLIHVNENDILHEMIATTIWGTPTAESAARLPRIPILSIGHRDGERLKAAVARGATVRMVTELEQGWTTIPLVVADVAGASSDFVLVATHLDAWYRGMTDTGGTVASILDMARVLQRQQPALRRGVRFAWWPGHSFGRYPGSTWYVDQFWSELDEHGVAYTNLDGSGRRGSRMEAVSAGGWPGLAEFSREFAQKLTGKAVPSPSARLFRPGRDSDSSFQGIGIPEFFIGVPGPPRGHPDVEETGRIKYWHAADDTIDKLDLKALELDTKYRVAQIYDLGTRPVLPLQIAPIAASYRRALDELTIASDFDLSAPKAAAAELATAAGRLDAAPRPPEARGIDALNALLVRLTHHLNATLYTEAGRFDQDPAADVPILPLLARARELKTLAKDSDAYGFLETELISGRNAVTATLREANQEIEHYLAASKGARSEP